VRTVLQPTDPRHVKCRKTLKRGRTLFALPVEESKRGQRRQQRERERKKEIKNKLHCSE